MVQWVVGSIPHSGPITVTQDKQAAAVFHFLPTTSHYSLFNDEQLSFHAGTVRNLLF